MFHFSQRRRATGFTVTELLVVIVMLAVVLAIQIPTDAASRRTARRMQNSTQLRGIHQGLVIFGQSNKFFYAGVDSRGNILANADNTTGDSGDGDTVQARYWILLRGDFFTPEYAISPSETSNLTEYDPGFAVVPDEVFWDQDVKNYSYAMLGINGLPGQAPESAGRGGEWKETANTQATVLTDRNTGHNATNRVQSIHTSDEGDWKGSLVWNDNHSGFEQSHIHDTKYGNGALNVDDFGSPADNLFAQDTVGENQAGMDALMIISGDTTVQIGEW
ncbi:MAG: hypothetical protein AAGC44_06660 [Planctomycetota bacterium]